MQPKLHKILSGSKIGKPTLPTTSPNKTMLQNGALSSKIEVNGNNIILAYKNDSIYHQTITGLNEDG